MKRVTELALAALLAMVLMASCEVAQSHEFTFEPFAKSEHLSAFTRGQPWNDKPELVVDTVALCATVKHHRVPRIEVDLCQGYKYPNIFAYWEEATSVTVRWYFSRRKP